MKPVAADRNVPLSWARSQAAGGSYLMHHCECGAKQGDNFLYATAVPTDTAEPGWAGRVCQVGHWSFDRTAKWPAGARVERPLPAVGLVGEPGGVFTPIESGGVSVQHVQPHQIRAMTRRMLGM